MRDDETNLVLVFRQIVETSVSQSYGTGSFS